MSEPSPVKEAHASPLEAGQRVMWKAVIGAIEMGIRSLWKAMGMSMCRKPMGV